MAISNTRSANGWPARYKNDGRTLSMRCLRPIVQLAAVALFVFATPNVNAQTYGEEAAKSIRAAERVAPLEDAMFGEQISLYNGSTKFRMVDVSLPSHNNLKVEFARTIGGMDPSENFSGWEVDVPKISTLMPDTWTGGWTPDPPEAVSAFLKKDYWQGFQLTIDGGTETLLYRGTDWRITLPTIPGDFRFMTKSGWAMQVVPAASGVGSTVIAHAPDGTKYHFDQLVKFPYYGSVQHRTKFNNGVPLVLGRQKLVLFVSKVEDRFGNWVRYEWAGAKLLRIYSNDGREIVITSDKVLPQLPESEDNRYLLKQIAVNGKIWTYRPNPSAPGAEIVNPDGSTWNYEFSGGWGNPIAYQRYGPNQESLLHDIIDCSKGYDFTPGQQRVIKIKHPSGATAEYQFVPMRHGRTNVPSACFQYTDNPNDWNNRLSTFDDVFSLISKTVAGPGIASKTTTYRYEGLEPAYVANAPPPNYKRVTVRESDGSSKTLVFGRDWELNEGVLLSTLEYSSQSVLMRKTDNSYLTTGDIATQPFPLTVGSSRVNLSGGFSSKNLPLRSRVLQQDGATFTTFVDEYDQFANPATVRRYSSLGYSVTDTTTYESNLSLWVLSQVKRRTTNSIETARTDYWLATALPQRTWAFGKPQQYFLYHPDGAPASITDANDKTTELSDWYRGIPRLIRHPATPEAPSGATESAIVDPSGWVTAVTDENNYSTGYGYDAMGRLSAITYPAGDSVSWTPTTRTFLPSLSEKYGLPIGHWQQTVSTGNARSITYFDGLWRPVVVETFDATSPATIAATTSITVTRYDANGHAVFQSYPMRTLTTYTAPTEGLHSEYDTLDRVTAVRQNSELGLLSTITEYLPNFQIRVTNPRNKVTTTSYMAYDQPSTDWPVAITHPAGAYTNIGRDAFGKPLSLLRHNADNSDWKQHYFAYDNFQRLCKRTDVETGTTAMGYDEVGNLLWSAAGLPWSPLAPCEYTAANVAAQRVDRTYDARNRLKTLRFPDTRGNQDWEYYADGLPWKVTTVNVPGAAQPTNLYAYNKRRLLTTETLALPAWYTYSLGYGYDANGNLASQTYPSGNTVQYAPNALGQATQVAGPITYASNVRYHPNGAIASFTYGNGLGHSMLQSPRQLPARSTDGSGLLDLGYDYDANGNVGTITDYAQAGRQTRSMTYDDLDRLKTATSPMFGVDPVAEYAYDTLDNLKRVKTNGRDHTYNYNANHQLETVNNTIGGAGVIGLGYDIRGNVNNKSGMLFDFDFGNRLRETTQAGVVLERYRYDAAGRRILANRISGPTGSTGVILSQYASNGQLMYESNERTGKNTDHIYLGGSLIAQREVLTRGSSATVKYQHTDALGSPIAVTNSAGNVIERMEYEPFGKGIFGGPDTTTPRDGPGYTGHVLDVATGMNYMQQRYYDPQIGRFLSVDPVTANSVNGSNFNRYWYANNNPYANKDPDGRLCAPVISSSEMCDRSLRYAAMDQDSSISSQTRFFAAASMVTNALGTLAVAQTPFMTSLSRGLEQHNAKMAAAIRSGNFLPGATPSQRDAAFVHSEQTLVQGQLDNLKSDSPTAYSALITGVNSLLNSPTFGQRGDPNFGRAIRVATKAVGGPLDFARQSHREALGRAAIGVARSQAEYCTGSRIRRC